MQLLTGAQCKKNHTKTFFLFYLYLGDIAYRFGITDLAHWAWDQLGLILKSARQLVKVKWPKITMLRMLEHFDAMLESKPDVAFEIFALFQLLLSVSTDGHPLISTQPASNIDTCVLLYKDSPLLAEPARGLILGCAFVVVLSLGHRSSVWKDQLTRDQRYTLYAAQAHLVSLRDNQHLEIKWLQDPQNSKILGSACSACAVQFNSTWEISFGLCGTLNSHIPLEDVSNLARLPQCRQIFAEAVRCPLWSASCKKKCNEIILREIDVNLDNVFRKQLLAAYSHFAE
jgi:hypothetical protein